MYSQLSDLHCRGPLCWLDLRLAPMTSSKTAAQRPLQSAQESTGKALTAM